jgi:hypothetical protein
MNRNLFREREIPEHYDTLSIDRGVLLFVVKARTDVQSHFHSTKSFAFYFDPTVVLRPSSSAVCRRVSD